MILFRLAIVAASVWVWAPPALAAEVLGTLRFGGLDRTYRLRVPEGHDPTTPTPLLIGLHGGGGGSQTFSEKNGFAELADRGEYLGLFPDAVNGVWNDGRSASVDGGATAG